MVLNNHRTANATIFVSGTAAIGPPRAATTQSPRPEHPYHGHHYGSHNSMWERYLSIDPFVTAPIPGHPSVSMHLHTTLGH